jgi:acetyl esterase/lipase
MEQKKARFHFQATQPQQELAQERRLALMMKALKAIHSASSPESMAPEDLERQRNGQDILGRLATPMIGMKWEPFTLRGMKAAWVRPEWGHDHRKVILYCHGGGYTSGNLGYSRPLATKLSHVSGRETLCFEYRLAPEHPYPAALEDAQRAWDYLMYQGYGARDVTVVGDSAGGNLALVLVHRLRAQHRQQPSRLVLLSPWTDMTLSGASYTQRAALDPTITMDYIQAVRHAYAGDQDLTSPMLSPLFGDFTDFPPTLVQVGSNEILYSDAYRLHAQIVAAGSVCQLEEWRDMWHVFQMLPMKKAAEAMDHIGTFLAHD